MMRSGFSEGADLRRNESAVAPSITSGNSRHHILQIQNKHERNDDAQPANPAFSQKADRRAESALPVMKILRSVPSPNACPMTG